MTLNGQIKRPHTTVILAMTVDGKITDRTRSPARFGSINDKIHLETQIAIADGVLFGSDTLRAYGTTMRVSTPELLKMRENQGKPSQPIQMVCSRSPNFDPNLRFFQQPVPRWLLTTKMENIPETLKTKFDRILVSSTPEREIDFIHAFNQLAILGWEKLVILGGGKLVASLLKADLIDEFWLTICPLILGGVNAPTPVEGEGFLANLAPKLELLAVNQVAQEVFLHYRLIR
ncbi:riboflavin deaminase [Oscillatoriales cyanobacterium USR001]|nr:riboflavin deaminase [Oscillatoriales cyanobacterium USR001]